jgi:hypothetical protein
MKTLFSIFFALALTMTFIGCGQEGNNNNDPYQPGYCPMGYDQHGRCINTGYYPHQQQGTGSFAGAIQTQNTDWYLDSMKLFGFINMNWSNWTQCSPQMMINLNVNSYNMQNQYQYQYQQFNNMYNSSVSVSFNMGCVAMALQLTQDTSVAGAGMIRYKSNGWGSSSKYALDISLADPNQIYTVPQVSVTLYYDGRIIGQGPINRSYNNNMYQNHNNQYCPRGRDQWGNCLP